MIGAIPELVLVEDNLDDEMLSLRAIQRSGTPCHVTVKRDGAEALEHLLDDLSPVPDLIVLDFQLPNYTGLEVLQRLRGNAATRLIPVVVFSGTHGPRTLNACYGAGANSCLSKPTDFDAYMDRLGTAVHYWLALNEGPSRGTAVPDPAVRLLVDLSPGGPSIK